MNPRQRFLETLRFGKPDRTPLLEEGIRAEVLRAWRKQSLDARDKLTDLFQYDPYEELSPDLEPHLDVLELASLPDGLTRLARSLDPRDPRRLPRDWEKRVAAWRRREHPLVLEIHEGFFLTLGVGDWRSFSRAAALAADQPGFVREVFRIQGEFAAQLADHILEQVQLDAVLYSEPIAGNHGALISPRMYADLVLPSWTPLMEVIHRHGVDLAIFRTYANPWQLLPQVFDAGFNCLWACERPAGALDYLQLRSRLGGDLRLIGGIDVDVLREGPSAIQQELERVVPPLLSQGGYLPLADGRVRENIPFSNYRYYRGALEQIALSKP